MRRLARIVLGIALLASLAGAQTITQTKSHGFALMDERAWGNLAILRPNDEVNIVDQHLMTFEGRFINFTDEAITMEVFIKTGILKRQEKLFTIARQDVYRVSSFRNSHRTRNTLIGMAVGAAAGVAVLGGIAASGCCNPDYSKELTIGIFSGIGAGIGAPAGAGIGYGVSRPGTIYRAEKRTD